MEYTNPTLKDLLKTLIQENLHQYCIKYYKIRGSYFCTDLHLWKQFGVYRSQVEGFTLKYWKSNRILTSTEKFMATFTALVFNYGNTLIRASDQSIIDR